MSVTVRPSRLRQAASLAALTLMLGGCGGGLGGILSSAPPSTFDLIAPHAARIAGGARGQLVVADDIPMKPRKVSDSQMGRELAWRRGVLMFDGERLAEAAKELNRYSRVPIVIEDPALAQRTFVGAFEIGDSRAFANAAASAFDARVTEENGALRLAAR